MAKSSRKKARTKTKKKAAGASGAKKATAKKTSKSASTSKATSKKKAVTKKKTAASKKTKVKKVVTKKKAPAAKKAGAKKVAAKKTTKKAPAKKTTKKVAAEPAKPAAPAKKAPKGITIVSKKKTSKKPRSKPKLEMPKSEPLLKPGGKWKPLIPSGPDAAPDVDGDAGASGKANTRKLSKRELEKYRKILHTKRAELLQDISTIEDEALRQSDGSSSHTPSHMAEAGSDTYDQNLSLNLAQVDRKLLREIDEALERIDEGTYGLCMITGRRIRPERLEELPWAKYSIDAARELERRPYQE